jgi:pimeloyl-ACP methyl ester carboxylesterase
MTPLYFGTGARRLFGIYEPGRSSIRTPRAAVLCYPWGQEYIRAHRSMRRLANMLAATGRDALRFDYFGTGDSAGNMVDADLAGWESDIETAIDEVRDTSGAPQVALLGLRLGGALAARVAAKRQRDVEALVLWDPVVSGQQYLKELHDMEASVQSALPVQRAGESGGGHEIHGFSLTTALAAEIDAFDLLSLVAGLPTRTLTLFSRSASSNETLATALQRRPGNSPAIERTSCPPAWLEDRDTGAGAIPVKSLQRIVQWLA